MEAKGNLRKNTRKEKDSHPDLTGKWTDSTGQQFWLSAWRNVDQKTGDVWFSLKLGNPVEPRGEQPMASAQQYKSNSAPAKGRFDDMDDSIPF